MELLQKGRVNESNLQRASITHMIIQICLQIIKTFLGLFHPSIVTKKQGSFSQQTHANVSFRQTGATIDQVQMVLHLRFLPPLRELEGG